MAISFIYIINYCLKNCFFKKGLTLRIGIAASSGGLEKLTYFMHYSWTPLEAALSIPMFLFLVYKLVMFRWFPKEITQHQGLVRTTFHVHKNYDAVIFVDYIFYCFHVQINRTCTTSISRTPLPLFIKQYMVAHLQTDDLELRTNCKIGWLHKREGRVAQSV